MTKPDKNASNDSAMKQNDTFNRLDTTIDCLDEEKSIEKAETFLGWLVKLSHARRHRAHERTSKKTISQADSKTTP